MPVPCLRQKPTRDLELSDEMLFLMAVDLAEARGFDWTAIPPEDRGDWARRVVEWEAERSDR